MKQDNSNSLNAETVQDKKTSASDQVSISSQAATLLRKYLAIQQAEKTVQF